MGEVRSQEPLLTVYIWKQDIQSWLIMSILPSPTQPSPAPSPVSLPPIMRSVTLPTSRPPLHTSPVTWLQLMFFLIYPYNVDNIITF